MVLSWSIPPGDRVKDRNIARDPRVALSIQDPDNPYRKLLIRGRVVEITTEGADAHIDKMAQEIPRGGKLPQPPPRRDAGDLQDHYRARHRLTA